MADKRLFSNQARSTLASDIETGTTTLPLIDGSEFQEPGANEYEMAVIDDGTDFEVVKITARATNSLTVTRAQEGTSAVAFDLGASVMGVVTKGLLENFPQGFDNDGNAKGADSVNLQPSRAADAEVASGANSVAVGVDTTASGASAIAIGNAAVARIDKTMHVAAAAIIPKDDGETDFMLAFAGSEVVIFSDEVELDATADDVAVVTLPSDCLFFANECGIVITVEDTLTVDPDVEFGITGTTDQLLAATTVTATGVGERTRFTTMADSNGQTTLTFSVETGATATDLKGRVYWKGLLVEDE